MDFSRLKIPVKELPLVALGITAVLISSIFSIPFVEYLLIGMFFGLLSKKTRWAFWGAFLLIEGFLSFRFLLRTDYAVFLGDSITGILRNIVYSPLGNSTFNSNASVAMLETFLESVGANPILTNPLITAIVSVISVCLTIILAGISIVFTVGYMMFFLPVYGHVLLMMYLFHKDMLISIIDVYFSDVDTIAEIPSLVRVVMPYLLQGIVIQTMLMTAICPLIFYKILKRIEFYKRIPGVHS